MFSLESFQSQHETDVIDLAVRGRRFRFHVPRSIDPFLNPADILQGFPLWAKIWEASVVLADHLAGMPADPERRFLEIGCGVGVVGIVAACFGHRITMTEYDHNALLFARANAHANLTDRDRSIMDIRPLDWRHPELDGRFDAIVGSEVIYKETDFEAIMGLFETSLEPSGEIILAEGIRRSTLAFLARASGRFEIQALKKALRSKDNEITILLARMRPRSTRAAGSSPADHGVM